MPKDKIKVSRRELLDICDDWRRSAESLRGEVNRGECKRQSPESKLARAQVLDSAAFRIEQVVSAAD